MDKIVIDEITVITALKALFRGLGVNVFLCLFFFLLLTDISAINKPKKIASIPFNMVGSYVVMKVKINDSSPLNLILDTGVRNSIITELLPGDNISLIYSDVKDLMGLGGGNHLNALTSNFNMLKIGKLKFDRKTVYVLQEDIFNLSRHTGTKVNGLIGIDFFQDYIVEIDYSHARIRFYDSNSFESPEGYGVIPMTFEGKKMFIELSVLEADSTRRKVKMLLDTGAELNAWFQSYSKESLKIPDKWIRGTIGQGLNGIITGKYGRVRQICIGDFCLNNPIVSFPDSTAIKGIVSNSSRNGTIGSQILSRFNLFIDYKRGLFYFKPNGSFKKPFKYNISGLEIAQVIPFVPQTEVLDVWENSPAALAGVKQGDQIIEINGRKAFQMLISEIKMLFETPSKYPLNLILMRDGKVIEVKIDMRSQI